jgi:hypothetical protein
VTGGRAINRWWNLHGRLWQMIPVEWCRPIEESEMTRETIIGGIKEFDRTVIISVAMQQSWRSVRDNSVGALRSRGLDPT